MRDAPEEKRRGPRRRVLKGAIVAYNDRRSTMLASFATSPTRAGGCAWTAPCPPDTFLLIIELDGIEVDCEVVWRKPPDLAVAFVSPPRKVSPKRAQIVAALVQDAKPSLRRKPKPSTP